jgi:hypothetical protein
MKQKPYFNTSIPWEYYDLKLRNVKWKRFRSCQAWTFYDVYKNLWIKSYATLVAVISGTGGLSIRGRYSTTTSKQIIMIYNSYRNGTLDYKD